MKSPVPKPKPEAPLSPQPVEYTGKVLVPKAAPLKPQADNSLQTRESLQTSLKQFLGLDLDPYFQALTSLKSMQQTIKQLIPSDVEMTI